MDDEEFEKNLNKEKSFINTSKNHTKELEKQLEGQKEESKVRDDTEKKREIILKSLEDSDDILTSSDSSWGIGALGGFIMSIVSIGIVLIIGFIILDEFKGAAVSSTQFNQSGVIQIMGSVGSGIPIWIGITIITALAFIVLSFFRIRD